jgi:radical SAM/Cys-rich protein
MQEIRQIEVLEKYHPHFADKLAGPVLASGVEILQINVGKRCNLSCRHCHVEAGHERKEIMSGDILNRCLEVIRENSGITTIDITGGAPEMNPSVKGFITDAAKTGKRLLVRSNLAILADDDYAFYAKLYADNGVEIVSSLPDCDESRADRQRGTGFFRKFIVVAERLNGMGYGKPGTGLFLNIVHNPVGAYLPASQKSIEDDYRTRLKDSHGLEFNALYCINNMPVGRYLDFLLASGNYEDYMRALAEAFNPAAVDKVMCRTTVSVAWDGTLYDCDFNQMLGLPVCPEDSRHIDNFDMKSLGCRPVVLHNHCYGCVAGAGSSCRGSLD